MNDNETDAVVAHRWWSVSDLETTSETIFPEGIADIVRQVIDRP